MSDPLDAIRERAESPAARTDLPHPRGLQHPPPATPEQIRAAEKSLDFALPELLKRVYLEIGNGGFGPGSGLIGLPGGATDPHGSSIVDLFDSFSASNPDDASWRWPEMLVPVCHWGEAVYSCADCSDAAGPIVCVDLSEYAPGRDLKQAMTPQSESLATWLSQWAEGVDLWQEMYPLELD